MYNMIHRPKDEAAFQRPRWPRAEGTRHRDNEPNGEANEERGQDFIGEVEGLHRLHLVINHLEEGQSRE